LSDVSLMLATADGAREGTIGEAVQGLCATLGARVATSEPGPSEEDLLDAAIGQVVEEVGGIELLVIDGASLFAAASRPGGGGHTALRACVDGAWNATRAAVNHAFLRTAETRGRIVYIAPAPDAGEYADAARAGLENLGRTLSIEWARHRITTVTIAPGVATAAGEVAALVAYLASPAGAYFSGCQLDLRGV
jgi:NAD(P)-dependent dehydrogenase (short-subunit alcohol dehydrogenase family)